MSYPAPPGLKSSSQSQPQQPAPLPARPPPSIHPQPAFPGGGASRGYAAAHDQQGAGAFRTNSPAVSQPARYGAPSTYADASYQQGYQQSAGPAYYPQQQQQQQQAGYNDAYAQPAAPQIHNPFPLPGQEPQRGFGGQNALDPEMEAQIAQWQSAYISKDDYSGRGGGGNRTGAGASTGANSAPLGTGSGSSRHEANTAGAAGGAGPGDLSAAANPDTGVASIVTSADGKTRTVVRSGGGQTWQDPSLLEWDPAHFRLFVGNLAGEVTDESLLKAFARFGSVQKARVVRDKRTTKSKGYGFVSFGDGDDYFQAAKEMQGKYIGSHPVLLRKATTEIKATMPPRDGKKKGGKGGRGHGGGGGGHEAHGGGIHKKQNKTKGGLKILG